MNKSKKILRFLSLADDKYIEEADPRKKKRIFTPKRSIIAACLCLAFIGLNLWLFLPITEKLDDISIYKNSRYYSVIEKLHSHRATLATKNGYKNNFEKLSDGFFSMFANKGSDEMSGTADTPTSSAPTSEGFNYSQTNGGSVEVTDNQVKGVTEADRFKRTDTHIFYLTSDDKLLVYSIAGEESALVASHKLSMPLDVGKIYNYQKNQNEFYLSENGKTITVITTITSEVDSFVRIISIDVSNPLNPSETKYFVARGSYLSSRVINDNLLLAVKFYTKENYNAEENFIPQYGDGNEFKSVSPEDIVSPDKLSSPNYTCIYSLYEHSLYLRDSLALLSFSDDIYVSNENIYTYRSYMEKDEVSGQNISKSEIAMVAYKDGSLEYKRSFTVDGYFKDQYSFDEKDGILRAVTTSEIVPENKDSSTRTSASLFCIDIKSGETVAEVKNFAPASETVRSVRFDGNYAYVCTAIEITDPVFFFDLSDLNNITYKDTGTISGFSTSLIDFKNGNLLGIGKGGNGYLKVEVYREGKNGVESVAAYEEIFMYSTEYKSYFVDRENQLIGLAVCPGDNVRIMQYLLLHFDGYELREVFVETLYPTADESGSLLTYDYLEFARACLIDDYLYMFSENNFAVKRVFAEVE